MRLNSIIKHLQSNGYKGIRQSIDCSACEDWAIEFKSDNFVFRLARLNHTMLWDEEASQAKKEPYLLMREGFQYGNQSFRGMYHHKRWTQHTQTGLSLELGF